MRPPRPMTSASCVQGLPSQCLQTRAGGPDSPGTPPARPPTVRRGTGQRIVQSDEAFGSRIGGLTEDDPVEDAEERGVRAHTESESQERNGGESGRSRQLAKRVAEDRTWRSRGAGRVPRRSALGACANRCGFRTFSVRPTGHCPVAKTLRPTTGHARPPHDRARFRTKPLLNLHYPITSIVKPPGAVK